VRARRRAGAEQDEVERCGAHAPAGARRPPAGRSPCQPCDTARPAGAPAGDADGMRRTLPLLLLLLALAVVVAACGEDADPVDRDPVARDAPRGETAVTTLTELETRLQEGAGLDLVRTGGRELGPQAGVPFLAHTRYEESQAGMEFDGWVLGDEPTARRAVANLEDAQVIENGGELERGCNVVALYAPRVPGTRLEQRVDRVLRALPCP